MALSGAQDSKKTGVLLVNLGSPDEPTKPALRRYLREFLSDPRVVNIPRFIWLIVLNFLVLPFRSGKSVKAYRKIWTEQGSPLVFNSIQLGKEIADQLDNTIQVDVAMRYGQPSMSSRLDVFKKNNIRKLIVLPLYPQYSSTTTASVFDALFTLLSRWEQIPALNFINDYHLNSAYIQTVADSINDFWKQHSRSEVLLISFHGLPAHSINLGDPYFYQCHATASLIADTLGLKENQWQIVFQSRFGKAEWLKPYCIEVLRQLPGQGVMNVDIVCPGFPVDCLETLEEIVITNKAVFLQAGGQSCRYISALNATQSHAKALINVINEHCQDLVVNRK